MTDTGDKKYNIVEGINRIYRALKGSVVPTDAPGTVAGDVLSVDEAVSKIAELAENKLAGETGQVPAGWTVPAAGIVDASETTKGIAELATTAEAEAGTDTARITTPAGVLASILNNAVQAVEIGEIYNTSTGTPVVVLSTSWTKITGSFQGDGASSDHVTPDYTNDRIQVSANGTYFVGLFPCFSGSNSAVIEGAAYVDGVRQETVRFRRKLGVGGDVGSAGALGTFTVTGTPVYVEFYAKADTGTPNFKLETGQLFVFGIVQEP
jgi:hypothetical protein